VLWPRYHAPEDLADVERTPLEDRGLPTSTYALLARAAELRPGAEALVVLPDAARWQQPVRRTYADLLADVHRYANALHAIGVRRDDVVTVLSPNCARLVPAVLAAQLAGVVGPVNPGLAAEHVAQLVARTGSRTVVAAGPELDPTAWETVGDLAARGLLDTVLVVRPTGADDPAPALELAGARAVHLDDVAAGQPADHFVGAPPTADDLASVFHTGGTTGLPKLAAHTHRNEVADAWMLAANDLLDEDSTIFAALPLFHVNALVVTVLTPLFQAQRAVWAGPLGYRDVALYGCFWQLVEHHRISTMSAVPTVYAVLAQVPVDADLSSFRFAMVGASALPDAVRRSFEEHTGVPLLEGYGLTEATCATARSFVDAPRPGSVGQRLPYQQVAAVDVDHEGTVTFLPPGSKGVLAIAGPTVFPGYVTGREDGRLVLDGLGALRDGWLLTGDLARVDADGFVHLAGRSKDLIIRGGHNIDPGSVEDVLLAHPDVTGAGVVGEPDEHAGEVPVAYVTLRAEARADADGLRAWAHDRVAERAAAPRRVVVVDALPLTDVGKPYKLALRARAAREHLAERLRESPGVVSVEADVVDGEVVVTVHASPDARDDVRTLLDRFALRSEVVA
jgi:fatty-acyl-CoA synthase